MSILAANSHILYREIHQQQHKEQQFASAGTCLATSSKSSYGFGTDRNGKCMNFGKRQRDGLRVNLFWSDLYKPEVVEMVPITDSEQLDQILISSQQLSQPIIIDWMASWCRKCIYLKPKLEKLATEFDTKIKFYCVDVNKVPGALVKRGNITKMPTIQIWKDGEMKEEVIGGHKAWLVVEEVRAMIQKYV